MAIIVGHAAPKQKQDKIQELVVDDSSFLEHLKYDPENLMLTVIMKRGDEYVHRPVYPPMFEDMMVSPSKGEFYNEFIKGIPLVNKPISKNIGKRASTKEKTNGRK